MEATINEFHHEDGEQVYLVSDTFLFLAAACPQQFFDQMAANSDVFNAFVSELERKSGGVMKEKDADALETFLSHLERQLRTLRLKDKTQDKMRLRLLKEINTMCIRVVDHDEPTHPCQRK